MMFFDENGNDTLENNSTANESLIDKWMEDPEFASSGRADRSMPSPLEQDAQVVQLNCSSAELTQQQRVPSNVNLNKKKCLDNISENALFIQEQPVVVQPKKTKREMNRMYSKQSRERKKQDYQNQIENSNKLSLENVKLKKDIKELQSALHDLQIVRTSLIHQECCGQTCGDVDINVPHTKAACQSKFYISDINKTISAERDGQKVILAAHQQQEQQPVQQESGSSVMASIVMPSNSYAFISNDTSLPSMPTANPVLLNPNLDPPQSDNLEVSKTESSVVVLENVKGQAMQVLQKGLQINSRPINIPHNSQGSSMQSAWCVETNPETDIEMHNLKSFFSKN